MKITKSNNIGFDYLEYETILEALYMYGLAKKNFLDLTRHTLTEKEIKAYEKAIERSKKLQKQLFEARNRYMSGCTNW